MQTTTTLPAWTHGERDERGLLRTDEDKPIWSNMERDPPAIGERVRIRINGIGEATTLAYFEQSGFLGIKVEVDEWPELLARQNDDQIAYVFGAEIV